MERIAILCSGGDSQGMNTCIKAFVNTCMARGITPIGVLRGYKGLIEDNFIFLNNEMVENIDGIGGTILKVSRSQEFRTPAGLDKAVRNLRKNQIDGLIVIGGNGKTGAGEGSHIFILTGEWKGNDPYIYDQDSATRVKKGKNPVHTWSGSFKVIALIHTIIRVML